MRKIIAIFCASLMLAAPLTSEAQPGPNDGGQGRPHNQQGGQDHGRPSQGGGYQQGRPQQHRPPQQGSRPDNPWIGGGPRPHNDWRRGAVAPPMYRSDRYWVTDWRSRHLRPPPRDHRWLWVNGDYVLVAITSGVIVQILSGY